MREPAIRVRGGRCQGMKVRPLLAEGDGEVILIERQASIPISKEELSTTVTHRSNSHVGSQKKGAGGVPVRLAREGGVVAMKAK
jgi:hypothetical protein